MLGKDRKRIKDRNSPLLTFLGFSHSYEKTKKSVGEEKKHVFLSVLNMCVTQLHYTPTQDISGVEDEDEDEANSNGDNRGKR